MIKKFKKKNSELLYNSIYNLTEELLTETDSTCLSRHVFNFLPSGKIIDLKIKNKNKCLTITVSDDREQVSVKTKDNGAIVTMNIPKEDTEEFKKVERELIDAILETICDMVD